MKLPILQYGDPMLRAKGKRIDQIDDRIHELAANMLETMQAANGVGLAAAARAEVRLPGLFSDNMVVQQGMRVAVWGWADEGEDVTVSFRGQKV